MKVSENNLKIVLNDFFKGIISLIVSQILIKIFGVIYSIYITNKTGFGDAGNAIYMSGYQIYALLLTISSIGVPNAISKIISEKRSQKDYINIDRVFKISVFLFSCIGFCGCVILYIFSKYIATNILLIPEATLSLKVLSPAVFFVSVTSVVRGFCNGEGKIYITAKSQFFEQVLKTIFTISFVEIVSKISNNNTEAMASIANFATTMATFFSLIYISLKYFKLRKKVNNFSFAVYPKERISLIIKKVLKISIPITIGTILASFGKNIDSITVVRILRNIIGEENAIIKYGILSSKVDIIMMLPLSFNIAISTSLIPEISKQKAVGNLSGVLKNIKFSFLITSMIAIPATFGLFVYSKQIFNLLFPNAQNGYELLRLSALGLIFSLLTQTINGILQGIGENNIPVYSAMCGLIIKLFSNIFLIRINGILEKGAVIGNILSSFVSFIIVYYVLRRKINLEFSLVNIIIKPFLCSIIMIIISFSCYNYLILKNVNYSISIIISLIIAVIIYGIGVFVTKMIKKEYISESIENTGKI